MFNEGLFWYLVGTLVGLMIIVPIEYHFPVQSSE